jgi:hypothetical protein
MQEILARPGYEKLPLSEQEFYGLYIDDSEDEEHPGFFVRQLHILWSEIDRHHIFDEMHSEHSANIELAQARYEARRRALIAEGFSHSDMEF